MLKKVLKKPSKIIAQASPVGGYGVFATEHIRENEIIEEATFVMSGIRTNQQPTPEWIGASILYPYPCNCESCQEHGQQFLLSTGYIQLYNHSDDNNVFFSYDLDTRTITVRTNRPVGGGNELFHNYGTGYNNFDSEWLGTCKF
tara:strand:+ start:140 stop:571 length:432 start_codon:yes stop_codon:yes gene_type:complete